MEERETLIQLKRSGWMIDWFNKNSNNFLDRIKSVGNVHFTVPRMLNTLFTGRVEIVKRIKNALSPHDSVEGQKRFIITGPGGMGKSEICIKVADVLRKE